ERFGTSHPTVAGLHWSAGLGAPFGVCREDGLDELWVLPPEARKRVAHFFGEQRTFEFPHPCREDEWFGLGAIHYAVPALHALEHGLEFGCVGVDVAHERQELTRGERYDVALNFRERVEPGLRRFVEEGFDTHGAIGFVPALGRDVMGIVGCGYFVVGVDEAARHRIEAVRQLVERQHLCPIVVSAPAGNREPPVTRLADGHRTGSIEPDVAVDVGVDDVLLWCPEILERFGEAPPIAGAIDPIYRLSDTVIRIEPR